MTSMNPKFAQRSCLSLKKESQKWQLLKVGSGAHQSCIYQREIYIKEIQANTATNHINCKENRLSLMIWSDFDCQIGSLLQYITLQM